MLQQKKCAGGCFSVARTWLDILQREAEKRTDMSFARTLASQLIAQLLILSTFTLLAAPNAHARERRFGPDMPQSVRYFEPVDAFSVTSSLSRRGNRTEKQLKNWPHWHSVRLRRTPTRTRLSNSERTPSAPAPGKSRWIIGAISASFNTA